MPGREIKFFFKIVLLCLFFVLLNAEKANASTIQAQWVVSCPPGWIDTEIMDDNNGYNHIGEDGNSAPTHRLCIQATDPSVTLTSEWKLNGCSAGYNFTGLYDDAGDISKPDDLPSLHNLKEDNFRPNGSNDFRWCLSATGGGATGAEGRWVWWASNVSGPPCNADEVAVFHARNYMTNLNGADRSGNDQGTMCIRVAFGAVDGVCGTPAGTCSSGSATNDNNDMTCGALRTWDCNGLGGGMNISCSSTNPPCSIDGVCGSAHLVPTTTTPSTSLCSAGNETPVSLLANTYSWSCAGISGGADASCSAPQIINGQCGPADGTPTAVAPGGGLCNAGTASALSGSGPWTWTCIGINTGSTQSCSAPLPPPPPTFGGACPT